MRSSTHALNLLFNARFKDSWLLFATAYQDLPIKPYTGFPAQSPNYIRSPVFIHSLFRKYNLHSMTPKLTTINIFCSCGGFQACIAIECDVM